MGLLSFVSASFLDDNSVASPPTLEKNMPQIEAVNLETLANSSMYVAISFERFGNSRKAKVNIQTEAVESRFSHSKRLLNSPELAAITKADAGIKAQVEALCLPSKHEMAGLRMAPNKNVIKIAAILKEYKTVTRPALIAEFIAVYPAQFQEAVIELKEHFNPSHFPSVTDLAAEFTFEYAFVNFGVPQSLADLSPELLEEETAKQQETFKDAMNSVADTMLATFAEMVTKLNDGLNGKSSVDGKKKSLLPSHFDKLTEFIAGFEAMSSFAPQVLKAEVAKIQALMNGVDIEKVKHSDNLKAELSAKTGEIVSTMVASGNLKGRFFRKPEPKPALDQVAADLAAAEAYGKTVPVVPMPDKIEVVFADGSTAVAPNKAQGGQDLLAAMLKSTGDNLGVPFQFEGDSEVHG